MLTMYYTLICGETFYFFDRGSLPRQRPDDMERQRHVVPHTHFTSTSPGRYFVDSKDVIDINSWLCMAEIIGFGPSQPNVYGHGIDPRAVRYFKANFPKPPMKHVVLYHGTSLTNAKSIMRKGFTLPKCKEKEECIEGNCKCGMMGQCIYFSLYDKATKFASEDAHWNKRQEGEKAVLRVLINLGKWITATSKPCICCDKPYVDHKGTWYKKYKFDTIYIQKNSLPAARRPEWATRTHKIRPLSFIQL